MFYTTNYFSKYLLPIIIKHSNMYKIFFNRSICEKFNVGKATAPKAVRRVTKAIVNLVPLFIKWPKGEKVEEVFKGFAACSAFPNVIGAIDGTHINIKVPHSNPECYINRKGHHSIHLQVTYVFGARPS